MFPFSFKPKTITKFTPAVLSATLLIAIGAPVGLLDCDYSHFNLPMVLEVLRGVIFAYVACVFVVFMIRFVKPRFLLK